MFDVKGCKYLECFKTAIVCEIFDLLILSGSLLKIDIPLDSSLIYNFYVNSRKEQFPC